MCRAVFILQETDMVNTMKEIDELDRLKSSYTLFSNLQKAEERAQREGWINAEDLEKELGVSQS